MGRPMKWRRSRLGRWVANYGGQRRVAEALRPRIGFALTSGAIAHYVSGRRTPRLSVAAAIVALSEGHVQLSDFGPQNEEES